MLSVSVVLNTLNTQQKAPIALLLYVSVTCVILNIHFQYKATIPTINSTFVRPANEMPFKSIYTVLHLGVKLIQVSRVSKNF